MFLLICYLGGGYVLLDVEVGLVKVINVLLLQNHVLAGVGRGVLRRI